MKILTFSRAVCVAALIASGAAPSFVSAGEAVSGAPAADYAEFRGLAEPLHLIDIVVGLTYDQSRENIVFQDKPAGWREAFLASVERGVRAQREDLTDAVMQHAFRAFDHRQIVRLSALSEQPWFERHGAAEARSLMDGTGNRPSVDPDMAALSPADRQLVTRLNSEMYMGIAASADLLLPIYQAGFRDAEAAAASPAPQGAILAPPVPGGGAAPDPTALTEGRWTYPAPKAMDAAYPQAAEKAGVEGSVVIDCAVMPTGQLVRCVIISESPVGYGFGAAAVAVYQAGCRVDPATVPGGIKPGAHRRFTVKWLVG
jgi:TonB family protein